MNRLESRGFTVVVTRKYSTHKRGTVFRQFTPAGTTAPVGDTITLLVAKPIPHVPGVLGRTVRSARRQLEDRGYEVVIHRRVSDQPAGTIISMDPDPGTAFIPGERIVLIVAKPAPAAPSNAGCNPNYAGQCLDPNASDYDCAGGSGDGPLYVYGTVQVVGYDEYGLDADGDGLGCE